MRCALCDQPSETGSGGVLRFTHIGKWSEYGVRETADSNLILCATHSQVVLKHLKRILSRSQLGCAKQKREAAVT